MEGSLHFVLETAGHCFLCLKSNGSKHSDWKEELEPEPSSEVKVDPHEEGKGVRNSISSIQNIFQYLKLNLGEVIADTISVPSSSLAILEESELKGALCSECSQLSERFSEHFQELTGIKKQLKLCLKSIYDRMSEVEPDDERKVGPILEKFKEEMLKKPETLQQYGIVEQLRTRTLERCSRKLKGSQHVNLVEEDGPAPVIARIMKVESVVADSAVAPAPQETIYLNAAIRPQNFISENDDIEGFLDPLLGAVDIQSHSDSQGRPGVKAMIEVEADDPMAYPLAEPKPPKSSRRRTNKKLNISCHLCQKRFTHPTSLRMHLKAYHLNLKDHECDFCGKKFSQKGSLQRHQRAVHLANVEVAKAPSSDSNIDDMPISIFNWETGSEKCPICSMEFENSRTFRTHYNNIHRQVQYEYECTECRTQFQDRDSYELHHQQFHTYSDLRCQKCGKTFRTKQILLQHQTNKMC